MTEPTTTSLFSGKSRAQLILLGCAAAAGLGCFMPWVRVQFFGTVSASRIDAGDGWVFLGGAAVLAALAWWRPPSVLHLLVALAGAGGFVYERHSIGESDEISVSVGSGLWLILVACIVAAAVCVNELTTPAADAPAPEPGWQPVARRYWWGLGLAAVLVVATVVVGQETHTAGPFGSGFTVENEFEFGEESTQPPIEVEVLEFGMTSYIGFDESPMASGGAVIENQGDDDLANLEVVFTFRDNSGDAVGTQTVYVQGIRAGDTASVSVNDVELHLGSQATHVQVKPVLESQFGDPVVSVAEVDDVQVTGGATDGYKIVGTASNPSDEVIDSATLDCVVRSDGEIVGGTGTYLDTITPGDSIAWDTTWDAGEFAVIDSADCTAATYTYDD